MTICDCAMSKFLGLDANLTKEMVKGKSGKIYHIVVKCSHCGKVLEINEVKEKVA